jgi:hypothetical protein
MKPGPLLPRRKLNPEFVATCRQAMLNGRPSWLLATLAGWPSAIALSETLHLPLVPLSAKTHRRLKNLAAIIDFPQDQILLPVEEQR